MEFLFSCPKCDNDFEGTDNFCGQCRYDLRPHQTKLPCCGAVIIHHNLKINKFCPICGKAVKARWQGLDLGKEVDLYTPVTKQHNEKRSNCRFYPSKAGQCLMLDTKVLDFHISHPETGEPQRMGLAVFFDCYIGTPLGWRILIDQDDILDAWKRTINFTGRYPEVLLADKGCKDVGPTGLNFSLLSDACDRGCTTISIQSPDAICFKISEVFFEKFHTGVEMLMPSYCGDFIHRRHQPTWMHRDGKFHKAWSESRSGAGLPTINEAAAIIDWFMLHIDESEE